MASTIQSFFEQYAAALQSYSAEAISDFYQTPVSIYSDNGLMYVDDAEKTLAFWKQGVKPYEKMGIVKSTFKILMEEKGSAKNWLAKVQWNNYNKAGEEVQKETNIYILTDNEGQMKISGLILAGQ